MSTFNNYGLQIKPEDLEILEDALEAHLNNLMAFFPEFDPEAKVCRKLLTTTRTLIKLRDKEQKG